jgi:hypothetical protein
MCSLRPNDQALGQLAGANFTAGGRELFASRSREAGDSVLVKPGEGGFVSVTGSDSKKAPPASNPGLSEIVGETLFDKIHSEPRWLPFLRRMGKAPEQLAQIKFKVMLPP